MNCKVLSIIVAMVVVPVNTTSCSLFKPPVAQNNTSTQASFDGNVQNSGIVGSVKTGGFEVTPNFRDRFNDLSHKYKHLVAPTLVDDQGLTKMENGNWNITNQSMVYFLDMNQLRKNGVAPKQ